MYCLRRLLLILPLCLLWIGPATVSLAAPAKPAAKPAAKSAAKGDDAPIHIEADHMTSLEKSNSVLFKGAVDARQDDVRIRTDEMTVFYTPAEQKKTAASKNSKPLAAAAPTDKRNQQVEKMLCVGNVEISRGEWLGTSKKMTYLAKERQVHLLGDAKAWQGQNMVSGDKIIYYLDEGRSEVVAERTTAPGKDTAGKPGSKPGRVNMTILQK